MSFFPNTRGVGYGYFQSNQWYHSSGMITTRNRYTNEKYLIRMKELLTTYTPQVLVLEEYRKTKGSIKTKRIALLIKDIAHYARQQRIHVVCYKRSRVRDVFSLFEVRNKYDIAKLLCIWIPSLTASMYVPRKHEQMEPYSSAVFDAISFCITWIYLEN